MGRAYGALCERHSARSRCSVIGWQPQGVRQHPCGCLRGCLTYKRRSAIDSLIGLGVGTTGCKANLFDRTGRTLGQGARQYAIAFPYPGWAEQDAAQVWQLAWSALKEAVREAGEEGKVVPFVKTTK